MNKWQVKVTFCMNDVPPVEFVVDDFDSVLSVLRVIKFKQEVFRIEFWQNRELQAALGGAMLDPRVLRDLGPIKKP